MNSNYGVNREFWRVEKFSLILLVVGLFLSSARYASLIMGIAGLLYVAKFPRLNHSLDGEHFLLLLSFVIIFLTNIIRHNSLYWSAYLCLTPLFFYQLGRCFMSRWQSEDNLFLLLLLLAISLGTVHIRLTIDDIIHTGIINPERVLSNIDEDHQRATTQRATEISLCFFGFSLLSYKPKNSFQRIAKSCFVIIGILALLCGFHYVSRTSVFLSLITMLTGIFLSRDKSHKSGFLSIMVFTMFFLLVLVVIGGSNTVFRLFHLYQSRGMSGANVASAGGRQDFWTQAISVIFHHPFGTKVDFFAHNLWLDVGIQFGIFPFVLLAWFSVTNFRKAIRIVRRKQESPLVRLCVCSFSILFFLSCFTEPIHVSSPNYLFVYMMFCGMINSIYHG